MRLEQAYQQWAAIKRQLVAASTWQDYESIYATHLARFGNVRLKHVPSLANEIISSVGQGRRAKVRTVLRMIAAEQGTPLSFPRATRNGAVGRVRNVPTQEHVNALAELCGPIVMLAAGSGLRWGEILALQATDVREDTIIVDKSWCLVSQVVKPPKSQAGYRTVVMLPECVDATSIVPTGPLHHSNFTGRVWRPAIRELGTSWRFHDLRHYYATTLIRRGVPIHLVSAMMGHSRTSVTLDIYAGFMNDDLDLIRAKIA